MTEYIILFIVALVIFVYFFRNRVSKKHKEKVESSYTIDDQYNSDKREREKEIDQLLKKMGSRGLSSLSEKDQKRLNELSKKI